MTRQMAQETTVEDKNALALKVAVVALLAGAAVAVAIGVYGRLHEPTHVAPATFGFGSLIAMKVWLGSIAGILALGQLISALWMYGKLGSRPAPKALGLVHRFSGAAAVIISLPVAYTCLWALGFESYNTRVLVHSLFGCIFYGAFVTKVIALHTKSSPGWLLPVAGGTLVTSMVVVVLASSVWYFTAKGIPPGG